jgi:transcriptional regulator with XRE-family HTH domain
MPEFDPKRLRELRRKRGLSHDQTAVAAGRSVGVYFKYENGTRRPSLETLCRLADVLQCDINEFFDPDAPSRYAWPTAEQREAIRQRVHRMAEFTDDEIDSLAAVITETRRAQVRGVGA